MHMSEKIKRFEELLKKKEDVLLPENEEVYVAFVGDTNNPSTWTFEISCFEYKMDKQGNIDFETPPNEELSVKADELYNEGMDYWGIMCDDIWRVNTDGTRTLLFAREAVLDGEQTMSLEQYMESVFKGIDPLINQTKQKEDIEIEEER